MTAVSPMTDTAVTKFTAPGSSPNMHPPSNVRSGTIFSAMPSRAFSGMISPYLGAALREV